MKEIECQHAAEEVMYMLIVHSFSRINVTMVPNLSKYVGNGKLDISLQGKCDSTGNWTKIKIERLRLGRRYAFSIMYGYFLKSVSLRYSLGLGLSSNNGDLWDDITPHCPKQGQENSVTLGCSVDKAASLYAAAQRGKADKLRGYMM
ncbi:hypothetical protein IEQ34_003088 [Dendrobium chrysotoxum]|uniref:Uncharacterized protein n=1 Tax=Dendrobium chrysotoxum TaxID=161865 RepID=A0AAV7HIT7_DENCH|nr:hypothetical protein IEQ34_003088 [Dendrobium chrysotoxum]